MIKFNEHHVKWYLLLAGCGQLAISEAVSADVSMTVDLNFFTLTGVLWIPNLLSLNRSFGNNFTF